MNLIALLIGLLVERVATHLFHWRRMRVLERLIDAGFGQVRRVASWPAVIPVVLLAAVLVLPVYLVVLGLGDTLAGFTYLVLAVVVLFFSLGPTDIGEEVDEYCKAVESEDEVAIQHAAKAIIEGDVPEDARARIRRVEESVCVQANNRLFAVIFWFVLLGPLGAWAYRVTDLIRRRAVFNSARSEQPDDNSAVLCDAAVTLHGWLAWIPARLTSVGYATAGHFDEAIAAMRAPGEQRDATISAQNEHLLARVGTAALALQDSSDETITQRGVRGAIAAKSLVFRQLIIWAVILSAMTLYGLTR